MSDSALNSFDEYQKKVLDILKESATLQCQNKELNLAVTELGRTKALLEKTLLERESDLDTLSHAIMQNVVESVESLKTLRKEICTQRRLSEVQYELDICMSCKRSLERDGVLHKNEIQRLTCMNSQLTQELKTLKYNQTK